MAELFDVSISAISEHLVNIFETAELKDDSVIRNFRITASDGKGYDTIHYNKDSDVSREFYAMVQKSLIYDKFRG